MNINGCTQLHFNGETFRIFQGKGDFVDEIILDIAEAQVLSMEIEQKIRCYKALGQIKL